MRQNNETNCRKCNHNLCQRAAMRDIVCFYFHIKLEYFQLFVAYDEIKNRNVTKKPRMNGFTRSANL